MNKIVWQEEEDRIRCRVEDLIQNNFEEKYTAFIGTVGVCNERDQLWLVNHSSVVRAENPDTSFTNGRAVVVIKKWVDITITVD